MRIKFKDKQFVDVIKYENIKGIANYNKASNIFKGRVLRDNPDTEFTVICSYDTDVFEDSYNRKPPVDWEDVGLKLKKAGAKKVIHIKAKKSIEDWFLLDLDGVCNFLKIKKPKKINGKNGNEKMKLLFKASNKVYQKGFYVHKFLEFLDYDLLYTNLEKELRLFVGALCK